MNWNKFIKCYALYLLVFYFVGNGYLQFFKFVMMVFLLMTLHTKSI